MNDHFIRVHPVYFRGAENGITTTLVRADAIYQVTPYEYESDDLKAGPDIGTAITFGATGQVVYITETEAEVLMLLNESMRVTAVRD